MSTEEKIIEIVSEHCEYGTDIIYPKDSLIDTLGLDSLDIVEVLLQVSDEFGVNLTDDETAKKVDYVEDLIYWVNRLLEERK